MGMDIGSEVAIHVSGADGRAGKIVGAGRVIHPRAVQILPPFDAELSRVARRADEFVLVGPKQQLHRVDRIRPGLVSYAEAVEILAREMPEVKLTPTETGLVMFETAEDLFKSSESKVRIFASPWWCKILCLNSCATC